MNAFYHALLSDQDIVTAYGLRVVADGGTYESDVCLRADVNEFGIFYRTFGIIYVANGYKANKLYALRPTNGDADLATVRATVATRRDSSGNIADVASGIPRLNTRYGYTCPRSLTEFTARTNLILRSEEVDNASWTKTNCTITANAVVGPDGASVADAMFETVTVGQHRIEQAVAKATTAILYSLSFYIKANGRDWIYVSLRNGANIINRWFNITTGTRGSIVSVGGTPFTFNNANILDAGNGWFRVELNVTSNNANSITSIVATSTGDNISTDFAGDVTKGYYIWGVQLEGSSSQLSSYIPTTTAAVTRNAETITTKTGLSTYLGTSGTIYFKGFIQFDGVEKRITLSDGTTNNRVVLIFFTSNKARVAVVAGGVAQADITAPDVYRSDSELRVVIVWATNDVRLYVNGVLVGTDTGVTTPSGLDRIDFTGISQQFSGSWRMFAVSTIAVTDAEAVQMSTPAAYPPVLKIIIPLTIVGNPDYYGFGNGVNINSFFTDYSIYLGKRGVDHVLGGGNGFGMLYNAKFNLWTSAFETIDDGTTYYSGQSAGLVGNQLFVQVARYTVTLGVDTFSDIGYFTSVDLTTLTDAEDLRDASSWNAFTALPTPTYNRYEAYGKIVQDPNNPTHYYSPWFEHNGTDHRLNLRKIIVTGIDTFTITNIQVHDSTNAYAEPSIVVTSSGPLIFSRQEDGTEMIHLWSGSSDFSTWTDEGDTNLGSSAGDCVVDTVYANNLVHVIYQDRGTGFLMKSLDNTYAQCLTLTLNTPVEIDYNAIGDSLNGLGYPSVWEIRSGVFFATWIKETSTTEALVYGTLTDLTALL